MYADKQASWLKRRKGSFLMMLALIHCLKSPQILKTESLKSKEQNWQKQAGANPQKQNKRRTKAGTPRTWRTQGETAQTT